MVLPDAQDSEFLHQVVSPSGLVSHPLEKTQTLLYTVGTQMSPFPLNQMAHGTEETLLGG